MPLYEYRCSDGHIHEALRSMDVSETPCACGRVALRVGANRVAITGPAEDSRGMYRRFSEASQELAYAAEKQGLPNVTTHAWDAAKQRSRAMIAAGEATIRKDSSDNG